MALRKCSSRLPSSLTCRLSLHRPLITSSTHFVASHQQTQCQRRQHSSLHSSRSHCNVSSSAQSIFAATSSATWQRSHPLHRAVSRAAAAPTTTSHHFSTSTAPSGKPDKQKKQSRMKAAATAQRHFALSLYQAILRAHRLVLDPIMRDMGDTYVRDEFKRHKTATPQFLQPFFEQWLQYLADLKQMSQQQQQDPQGQQQQVRIGRDLTPSEQQALSDEQSKQLSELQRESQKIDLMWDSALDEVEKEQRQAGGDGQQQQKDTMSDDASPPPASGVYRYEPPQQ